MSSCNVENNQTTPYKAVTPLTIPTKRLRYVPPLRTEGEMTFFGRISSQLRTVFMYEDERLQELARQCIPVERLEQQAKKEYESAVNSKYLIGQNFGGQNFRRTKFFGGQKFSADKIFGSKSGFRQFCPPKFCPIR